MSALRLRDRVRLGTWVPGSTTNAALFDDFETLVRGQMDIASLFYGFGDHFPSARERALAAGGRRDLLLSWDMGADRFSAWASGKNDEYLKAIGRLAADYPYPLFVRPWPEMNGDWQPFMPDATGSRPAGGTPSEFIAAWRHVVSTIRAAGGTRIKWVFNPYAASYPGTADVRTLWPGRTYVDVLAIDGYNWGGGPQGPKMSFVDIFTPMYTILTALNGTLPVWVCETSSKEPSVNDGAPADGSYTKGQWINTAFNTYAFPRMTAVVWFNERKERDWRVNSSSSSLTAFRSVVASRAARR